MERKRPPRLGVNVDHVATLRQARLGRVPSPVQAALIAQRAGCDGIVCHLREDRRHIQDQDVEDLKRALSIPLNLEMAPRPEMVRVACRIKPHQATLVPERRRELTTEGGLDLRHQARRLRGVIRELHEAGIRVSLFVDPEVDEVRRALDLGVSMVELHTGRYAEAPTLPLRRKRWIELERAARLAAKMGLSIAAGHGLDYDNVKAVARIAQIEELNIGFSIVAHAIWVGFDRAVRDMLSAIRKGRRSCG